MIFSRLVFLFRFELLQPSYCNAAPHRASNYISNSCRKARKWFAVLKLPSIRLYAAAVGKARHRKHLALSDPYVKQFLFCYLVFYHFCVFYIIFFVYTFIFSCLLASNRGNILIFAMLNHLTGAPLCAFGHLSCPITCLLACVSGAKIYKKFHMLYTFMWKMWNY